MAAKLKPAEHGQHYLGTSMDEIAALRGVSKQTVYKHFTDKEWFPVRRDRDQHRRRDQRPRLRTKWPASRTAATLDAGLRDLARRLLERVIQPRLPQLRRLVIGEAGRLPELGQTFYERGLGRTIDDLALAFEQLAGRDELQLNNEPRLAASQFSWLIMSDPINHAMLSGHDKPLPPAEIDRHAEGVVQTFLAVYSKR